MDLNVGGSSPLTHPERNLFSEHKLSVPVRVGQCGLKPLGIAEVFRRRVEEHVPRTAHSQLSAAQAERPGNRDLALSQEAILAALLVENAARCEPPLPEATVEKIAESVARYNPTHRIKLTRHATARYVVEV